MQYDYDADLRTRIGRGLQAALESLEDYRVYERQNKFRRGVQKKLNAKQAEVGDCLHGSMMDIAREAFRAGEDRIVAAIQGDNADETPLAGLLANLLARVSTLEEQLGKASAPSAKPRRAKTKRSRR